MAPPAMLKVADEILRCDKIKSPKIVDVSLSWNPGADIYIEFKTENKKDDFKCILRFGKGTGFSNIRFDMR